MIRHFRIGSPIETESVVRQVAVEETEPGRIQEKLAQAVPGTKVLAADKALSFALGDGDIVYGLGETVRGMNKRGWLYQSNCSDDPYHLEEKHSLYAAQNFLLVTSKERSYGLYVDTPGLVTFDIGYTKQGEMRIALEDFDAELYLVTGEDCREIVREFRELIGPSYIPPKWAFGFGQSRWSYMTEDEVREVADRYQEAGVPLDSIYLDIDYMERYKDFTVDPEKFPEFSDFVREMKERGIHLIPIIDAGVKIEEGYPVYEEGKEKGYFCKKEDGTDLVAAVWPGRVHFPDFLRPEVREWFGNWYSFLLDQGIDGFWNDMNEPAIFYTEDHLNEVFEQIEDYKGKNLDIQSFFEFKGLVGTLDNNPEDYRRFYHDCHGKKVRHDKVHNLFGYNMTRAAGEAFERLSPDKKILMFSRSSYIGMHRYGGIWTGDNRSWWSHILLNLQQLPALNMCGFLYSGADTGGFSADCTEDLAMRWLGVSLFTPLFRNHAAMGTRRQEFYQFERTQDFRRLIELRYALVPYLYSEFRKAAEKNGMYIEPLLFAYPQDERARGIEDQVLVGESIMIAPVYVQNAAGRYVYLPEEMKLLRFRGWDDYDEEELGAGDHYVPARLNEVLVFLRKGKCLPLAKPAMHVSELREEEIRYLTYGDAAPEYTFYEE
ncbi:MAG: glycoside hydrolase family 31 protein [Eubacteriales bacterium]|nr:glycoside hydrolase family 31 protein [Eubacteriales bacterium]